MSTFVEPNQLQDRLRGRADWLRGRGRIKSAELMEEAAAALDFAHMALAAIETQPTQNASEAKGTK